ncbi:hypothetical protein ABT340_39595 [Streptosporangium sp. NPDC000239]
MNVLVLLALICFLTCAIWSAITRAWPLALLAAGLTLLLLASAPLDL